MTESSSDAEIPPEVTAAFTAAAITALQELAGLEAHADELSAPAAPSPAEVVAATVRLQRHRPGNFTLVLNCETASQIAARYLPAGTVLSGEIIDDVAGEFANVIAGQAKTILKGTPYHFTLSTPRVCRETSDSNFPRDTPCCLRMACEIGNLLLLIDLEPCAGA